MSAILAISLILGGATAIAPISHSQQMVLFSTFSLGVTTSVTYSSAPRTINSSSHVNYYHNFMYRLFENAVLRLNIAYVFAGYSALSQNTSLSVVQLGDLKGRSALNFKNAVVFSSSCVAHNSLTHVRTRAIGFENKINFRGMTFPIDHLIYRSDRNK
jgi:hypothetical protein